MTSQEYDDLLVATAMLLGGEPRYSDYTSHWHIEPQGGPFATSNTKSKVAQDWLWMKHIHVWRHSGEVTSTLTQRSNYDYGFSTDL